MPWVNAQKPKPQCEMNAFHRFVQHRIFYAFIACEFIRKISNKIAPGCFFFALECTLSVRLHQFADGLNVLVGVCVCPGWPALGLCVGCLPRISVELFYFDYFHLTNYRSDTHRYDLRFTLLIDPVLLIVFSWFY